METKKSVEVILKSGEDPLLFHDITHAYIGNDGILRLERRNNNVVAEFARENIAGWHEL